MRFLLLLSTALMIPAANSFARNSDFPIDTQTHTPIELSSISSLPKAGVKLASVCFMGFGACDPNIGFGKGNDYTVDTEKQCLNEGFIKLNCSSVQVIDGVCPYNPAYGKACKCSPSLVACAAVQTGVGAACGGKYASCKCPTGVTNLPYGCQEYYASPCNSVCKTAYTACEIRNDVSCSYGCSSYWSDCSYKCQSCKANPCDSRTAVSVPTNASCSSTYYDCSSKCSAWSCNSGYNQSGNSCVPSHTHSYSCPSGYQSSGCSSTQKASSSVAQTCSCGASSGSCYKCVNKTCEDYGYYTTGCPSNKVKIWSGPTGANSLCYQCNFYFTGELAYTTGLNKGSCIKDGPYLWIASLSFNACCVNSSKGVGSTKHSVIKVQASVNGATESECNSRLEKFDYNVCQDSINKQAGSDIAGICP